MKEKYIFGLLGLAIGGALGYYFGYIRKKKEIEAVLEKEKAWYKKRCDELDKKYQKDLEENGIVIWENEVERSESKKSPDESSEKVDKNISPEDYLRKKEIEKRAKIIQDKDIEEMEADMAEAYEHPEEDEPDEEDVEEYLARQENFEPGGWKKPYIISEHEFMEEHEHDFDKIDVDFWGYCGTYSERDSGMPVEDPINIFGEKATQEAIEIYEDGEFGKEIFVRNEGLGIDYCIEVMEFSYRRGVLGMED